jgi:hypothetical protein
MNAWVAISGMMLCALIVCTGTVTITAMWSRLTHPLGLIGMVYAYYIIIPAGWLLTKGTYHYNIHQPAQSTAITLAVCLVFYALVVLLYVVMRFDDADLRRYLRRLTRTTWGRDSGFHRPDGGIIRTYHTPQPNTKRYWPLETDRFKSLVLWFGIIGFCLGLAGYVQYVTVNGSFMRLLTVTPRTAFQTVPNTGRFRVLAWGGIVGGYVTVWIGLRDRVVNRSLDIYGWFDFIAVFVGALGMAISYRARMPILIVLAITLVYLYTADIITDRLLMLVGSACVGLVVLFSVGEALLIGSMQWGAIVRRLSQMAIHTPRFEALVAVVEAVPERYPFQYGRPLVHIIMIDWADMPLRYGDHVQRIAIGHDTKYITFSALLLGELWLYLGAVGVICGALAYGSILGYVDRIGQRSQSWLLSGVYPAAIILTVTLLPTNLTWWGQTLLARVALPVLCACGGAYACARMYRAMNHV